MAAQLSMMKTNTISSVGIYTYIYIHTCLRLEVYQVTPHVFSSLSVVSNLCIGMKTHHLRCVCQWQTLNLLYNRQENEPVHGGDTVKDYKAKKIATYQHIFSWFHVEESCNLHLYC